MKFDGNLAWKQGAAWVSANRDVLIALAGVFFFLPSLAIALFVPQAMAVAGMTAPQILSLMRANFISSLPYDIPAALLQTLGILAILTLFTDRQRPTVGVAIRQSLAGIFGYIVAQLLPAMAIGVVAGLIAFVLGIIAATVTPALILPLVVLMILAMAAAAIYLLTRFSLSGPVIAIEKVRNPIAALTRSWNLTRGHAARLALFFVLLGIVLAIILSAISALVGIISTLALGPRNAVLISTVVSSALRAAVAVYIVAILGAAHRQLADPVAASERAPS